jgi:regulator of nucleoside diphosphate kinase
MFSQQPRVTEQDHRRLTELVERLTPEVGGGGRVAELGRSLESAEVLRIEDVPRSLVTMNSLVGLRDLVLNRKLTCHLVYPEKADAVQHKVSVTAPLGTQILGRTVGDVVASPVSPTATKEMRIEAIYYQPEASRDYHL